MRSSMAAVGMLSVRPAWSVTVLVRLAEEHIREHVFKIGPLGIEGGVPETVSSTVAGARGGGRKRAVPEESWTMAESVSLSTALYDRSAILPSVWSRSGPSAVLYSLASLVTGSIACTMAKKEAYAP